MKKIIFLLLLIFSHYFSAQNNFTLVTPKPTDQKAVKIAFSTDNVGFIINNNKELLTTNDQGLNWIIKQTLNFLPRDIKFRNNIGFIVGENTILRTADYGATWNSIPNYGTSLNSINFISNDIVYISGQTQILKSSDNGVTFPEQKIMNGMSVSMSVFTDANTAVVTCFDGRIRRTTNGGDSWTTNYSDNSSANTLYTLVFPSQNIGYANKGFGEMLKTIDGGQTWTAFGYSTYYKETYGMQFFDDNNGIVVGYGGAVYKTTNGGTSWQWMSPNSPYSTDTDYNLNSLYFFNNQTGICVGNNGRIIKTQNGGTNWTNYSPTYDVINEIHFIDPNKAYFKTNLGELFKTQNAGNNWQKVQYPAHQSYSNGFVFLNENVGYSFGANQGVVYKTIDGATTWTSSTLIPYESIYSFSFLNENIGFASGGYSSQYAGFYKTTDGANSWQKISDEKFSFLKFFNNNVGYAVKSGIFYKLFKTTDGGITWNQCFDTGSSDIHFDFLNENQIFLKGNNGDFFKSNDGGTTWIQSTAPYYSFDKVKFINSTTGFIADDRMVYGTIDAGVTWTLLLDNNYNFDIMTLEASGDYLYISGNGGKIFKYSLAYLAASEVKPEKNSVKVYPNPTSDFVNIKSDKKVSEIKLIDISGKILKTVKAAAQINISEYPHGMYFLEVVFSDNTKQVSKIIKK
ncbi:MULTISPECIES: YCF48-related protein [Chryseobacterium]|uniref:YCF48-related protein n=1 Tax=Chryseobacterium TaxID=59732 RepID=UPI000C9E4A0B|nr:MULTISPECIES: YCF48-related protein [Chryseobacterium]VXB22950.1 Por secretion system C-terminal sorting domain-containing protein [Chryseobacterium sp. 8AT]